MLQIHNVFNLVATLYETRLLQPKISIWEMLARKNGNTITTNDKIDYI